MSELHTFAKYPFLSEASDFISNTGLSIGDLAHEKFLPIVNRGEERLIQAILKSRLSTEWQDDFQELMSFPVAVMLTGLSRDVRLIRRMSLVETKRVYDFLQKESKDFLLDIAQKQFHWKVQRIDQSLTKIPEYLVKWIIDSKPSMSLLNKICLSVPEEFVKSHKDMVSIDLASYLRGIQKGLGTNLKWRLVNRIVNKGYVWVDANELARLLSEDIYRFYSTIFKKVRVVTPPSELVSRVRKLTPIMARELTKRVMPLPRDVQPELFPPCMMNLLNSLDKGVDVPHMGRFSLASFLLASGMPQEAVIEKYRHAPDFNVETTSGQVAQIAKVGYVPPNCKTMQNLGLCYQPNEICQKISSPLRYYKYQAWKKRKP